MAENFDNPKDFGLNDTTATSSSNSSEKKRRINYRKPENAAKLNAAVNALIMQKQDPNGPQDIRTVSKLFNIPYNTLRDNYIRVTTGTVRSSKRIRKRKFKDNPNLSPTDEQQQNNEQGTSDSDHDDDDDDDEESDNSNVLEMNQ